MEIGPRFGRGRRFTKENRPRGGRPKGAQNRSTLEVREACRRMVDDPTYQRKLLRRLRAAKLHPAVEVMIWHYAHGKPKETLEVNAAVLHMDPSKLSDAELTAALGTAFEEMRRLADQEQPPAIDVPALPAHVEEPSSV